MNKLMTTALAMMLSACTAITTVKMEEGKSQTSLSTKGKLRSTAILEATTAAIKDCLQQGYEKYRILSIVSSASDGTIGGGFGTTAVDLATRSFSSGSGIGIIPVPGAEVDLIVGYYHDAKGSEKALWAEEELDNINEGE